MSIYSKIYYTLCEQKCTLKNLWKPGSGIHQHHILPRHSGGLDAESNYTYLTIREHVIAHWLLWKIHGNVNDLRSMKMLGAKLTYAQRSAVGKWCHTNQRGFHHPKYADQKSEWSKKGCKAQIKNEIGIHDPENFTKHASMGGKAAGKSAKHNWKNISKADRQVLSSMGGKANIGLKCMHRPGVKGFKKFWPNVVEEKLKEGWVLGMGYWVQAPAELSLES